MNGSRVTLILVRADRKQRVRALAEESARVWSSIDRSSAICRARLRDVAVSSARRASEGIQLGRDARPQVGEDPYALTQACGAFDRQPRVPDASGEDLPVPTRCAEHARVMTDEGSAGQWRGRRGTRLG